MTHPPIPPNCPHFETFRGEACFITGLLDSDLSHSCDFWRLDGVYLGMEEYARFRLVIAAVARCAWLDERERRSMNVKEFEAQYKGDIEALKKNGEVYWLQQGWWADEGNKNAELWARWGRGESQLNPRSEASPIPTK